MSEIDDGEAATEVPLAGGGVALVSPEDADRVLALPWRIGSNGYVYCCRRSRQQYVLLHRFVVQPVDGVDVHHINRDKADCRRANLCLESPSDHQRKYHSHVLVARNVASRRYPAKRRCNWCETEFVVNPSHRGRNRFCSKTCGNRFNGKQRSLQHDS